jgi:hypothetical protein
MSRPPDSRHVVLAAARCTGKNGGRDFPALVARVGGDPPPCDCGIFAREATKNTASLDRCLAISTKTLTGTATLSCNQPGYDHKQPVVNRLTPGPRKPVLQKFVIAPVWPERNDAERGAAKRSSLPGKPRQPGTVTEYSHFFLDLEPQETLGLRHSASRKSKPSRSLSMDMTRERLLPGFRAGVAKKPSSARPELPGRLERRTRGCSFRCSATRSRIEWSRSRRSISKHAASPRRARGDGG